MRALLISAALVIVIASVPAAAQEACSAAPIQPLPGSAEASEPPLVPIDVGPAAAPALLAPLAAHSPWTARFESAADALLAALQSGRQDRWQPLLGGQWLGDADRQAVHALIDDRCGAFAAILGSRGPIARRIWGWSVPPTYSDADMAAIAARPEAEALVCWSARTDVVWPSTAREADNRAGRPYACARITYSVRGDTPIWRGFIEQV